MGQGPIINPSLLQLNNPIISFDPSVDQFQSIYIQRLKQTPFIASQVYSLHPPIHADPIGIPLIQLTLPRFNNRQLFPQNQVINMLLSLTSALIQLEEKGYEGHGDISNESVYYCKNTKLFKLKHPKLCNSAYLLAKHGKRFSILSPEQLLAMSNKAQNSQISYLSDIFVLGILMFEVTTLTLSAEIYCPQTYKIFDQEIQNRLKIIQEYYSTNLMSIIGKMVSYNSQDRPKLRQIINILHSENKNIISKPNVQQINAIDYPTYQNRNL